MEIKDVDKIINIVCGILLAICCYFLFFGVWLFFLLNHFFFNFPIKKVLIFIILIPFATFFGSMGIYETYTWIRQLCCSHVWDNEDTPRVCVKCGKEERIWADGGYGRYD